MRDGTPHQKQMKIRSWLTLAMAVLTMLAGIQPVQAQIFQTKADYALLIDLGSGSRLFEKNAAKTMAPASMAKLMTAEIIMYNLTAGGLTLDDEFIVSENAWRKGGASSRTSSMFAKLNSTLKLRDILKSIIIQSGNDACIVFAEGFAGSEEAFAKVMNKRAKEIGLKNSYFANPTGLPDPTMRVTPNDLAILARHIIETYPEFYPIFAEKDFEWNGIKQQNRNPILNQRLGKGGDGLKTGSTKESGFGLVASSKRKGQRLIMVLNGLKSARERRIEAHKLMNWGFRSFENLKLYAEDETVGKARVFGGEKTHVRLVGRKGVNLLIPRGVKSKLRARIVYQGPIPAPVEEGTQIATLKVWRGKAVIQETPLFAGESIAVGGLQRRAMDALIELSLGWL